MFFVIVRVDGDVGQEDEANRCSAHFPYGTDRSETVEDDRDQQSRGISVAVTEQHFERWRSEPILPWTGGALPLV